MLSRLTTLRISCEQPGIRASHFMLVTMGSPGARINASLGTRVLVSS